MPLKFQKRNEKSSYHHSHENAKPPARRVVCSDKIELLEDRGCRDVVSFFWLHDGDALGGASQCGDVTELDADDLTVL